MACGLHVTWDERLTDYHFGPAIRWHRCGWS
jgi:hypothetical protein